MISELCLLNILGLILSVWAFQVTALPHLSWSSHHLSGVFIFTILTISFLHLIFFSILPCAIYVICLCSCLFHFLLVTFIHPLFPFFSNSAPCIIITLFLSFSLCPCEVNLHTYLTTWLNSCPVRIFLGFSP